MPDQPGTFSLSDLQSNSQVQPPAAPTATADPSQPKPAGTFSAAELGGQPLPPSSATSTNAAEPTYLQSVQDHVTNTAKALWTGMVNAIPQSVLDTGNKYLSQPLQNTEHAITETGAKVGRTPAEIETFFQNPEAYMPSAYGPKPQAETVEEAAKRLHPIVSGVGEATGKFASQFVTPTNLALMAAMPEAEAYPLLQKVLATGFAAQMGSGLHEQTKDLADHWGKMTEQERVAALTELPLQVIATAITMMHAAHSMLPTPEQTGIAKQEKGERAKVDATNATLKGPQERTVAGPSTTFTPTTQTTAGVEAPIAASQQENPSATTTFATNNLTNPGAAKEFQKTQTYPAAEKQLISTGGQIGEDKINNHNAIMEGRPAPDQIAGTQTPSKFQTHDEIAHAMEETAQKTYRKADVASDADVAAWQQTVKDALNEHKELLDRHNANIDAYNDNLAEGEEKMPHAAYDPNAVSIPEKPQSYSELKAELDRAKADGASSDAAVREEAYKSGIPKAEKAVDNWFKQHSDVISPAEYASAKKLYSDSQRFQEIANGLRASAAKGAITGNTLRGLEANMDNRMIRRGQGPGAFKRLLGEDGYNNWQTVTKLFDPLKGAPKGIKSWGVYALEAASALVAPHLAIAGIAGTMATKFLMDRIMFNPAWGDWFSKLTNNIKDMVTREHGELGAPGTVGEKFGEGGAGREFDRLMDSAQGKAAGEVKEQSAAQAQATPEPEVKPAPTQTVGTAEGAARDTALFQQAKAELGESASFSDIAKRAQELKTATRVTERAGGYKKPDWVRPEDWEPKGPSSILTHTATKALLDKMNVKGLNPVGSIASQGWSLHDVDLLASSPAVAETAKEKLQANGFEWTGRGGVSPKEVARYGEGKDYGDKNLWSVNDIYRNKATGEKLEVWHKAPADISTTQNQMTSLGTGDHQLSTDVNPEALQTPEVEKWKGQPKPSVRRPHDLAAWYNANTTPADMVGTTAHEIAHYIMQKHAGVPTDASSIVLGNSVVQDGISAGYLETGPGWNQRWHAALNGKADMTSFLTDYASHAMAGKAIESILGIDDATSTLHADADIKGLKKVLRHAGMSPEVQKSFISAATDRAAEVLKSKWQTVHNMTNQAAQHYGGNIDADTLQRYHDGGKYQK